MSRKLAGWQFADRADDLLDDGTIGDVEASDRDCHIHGQRIGDVDARPRIGTPRIARERTEIAGGVIGTVLMVRQSTTGVLTGRAPALKWPA